MKNNFILVENVISPYDDIWWLYIPGFNGYEVSTTGIIRSMKHYRKYPFGILIQPKKDRNGKVINPQDPTYELSNNQNERIAIKLSQILYLAKTNPYHITGYPRRTCITDISPRNQRCFIKKETKTLPGFNGKQFMPKFNIVKEEYNPFAEERLLDVICPIESINNEGEYYGRKDYRAFSYFNVRE